MAWTAPITFVANSVLTAAQLNSQLRDNMLETAPAKATLAGSYFAGNGLNSIVERIPARLLDGAAGTTTSTSYTDLSGALVGPQVSVVTSARAMVYFGVQSRCSTADPTRTSVAVSGASTIAADDARAIVFHNGIGEAAQASHAIFYENLTPGLNTFTMKYRVSASTGTFEYRRIAVFPY